MTRRRLSQAEREDRRVARDAERVASQGLTLAEVLRALKGEGLIYYGLGDQHIADEYQRDLERAGIKRRQHRRRATKPLDTSE